MSLSPPRRSFQLGLIVDTPTLDWYGISMKTLWYFCQHERNSASCSVPEQSFGTFPSQSSVLELIEEQQRNATCSYEEQQTSVNPMSCWVALFLLISLIDPDSGDLAWCAKGDVQSNSQACCSCTVQVRGQPAQQRRDARERTGGSDNQTAIASIVCIGRKYSRGQEPNRSDRCKNS